MVDQTAGWLPCDDPEAHEPHEWIYTDPNNGTVVVATCDGDRQPIDERPTTP